MELSFLPAVTHCTVLHLVAPFIITGNKSSTFPLYAHFLTVGKHRRIPPEVLPVMGIRALGLVVLLVNGAPFCLKKEHVEVPVFRQVFNEPHFQIVVAVGERTVFTVLTFVSVLSEIKAELSFVFLDVVKSLGAVVRAVAVIVFRASVAFLVLAELWSVNRVVSPFIF